jgi:hypothetical protein
MAPAGPGRAPLRTDPSPSPRAVLEREHLPPPLRGRRPASRRSGMAWAFRPLSVLIAGATLWAALEAASALVTRRGGARLLSSALGTLAASSAATAFLLAGVGRFWPSAPRIAEVVRMDAFGQYGALGEPILGPGSLAPFFLIAAVLALTKGREGWMTALLVAAVAVHSGFLVPPRSSSSPGRSSSGGEGEERRRCVSSPTLSARLSSSSGEWPLSVPHLPPTWVRRPPRS